MFKVSSIITIIAITVSCARNQASSHLSDTATKEECEISKKLTVRPESEFPTDQKDVFRLVSASAKATCLMSGWGWRVASWDTVIEVTVENLDFDKRFEIAPLQANPVGGRLVLKPEDVTFLGSEAGYDRFRFKSSGIAPTKISVMMPAQFNTTPNIGNPVYGWYGPSYGLVIESIKN